MHLLFIIFLSQVYIYDSKADFFPFAYSLPLNSTSVQFESRHLLLLVLVLAPYASRDFDFDFDRIWLVSKLAI